MMPTEAECQAVIVKAAMLAGWRVHAERTSRTQSGGWATAIQGHPGFCDLVLVRGEQLWFLELKRDKTGRIGPGQDEWIDALEAVPGVRAAVIWVPSEQDRLIKMLQRKPT